MIVFLSIGQYAVDVHAESMTALRTQRINLFLFFFFHGCLFLPGFVVRHPFTVFRNPSFHHSRAATGGPPLHSVLLTPYSLLPTPYCPCALCLTPYARASAPYARRTSRVRARQATHRGSRKTPRCKASELLRNEAVHGSTPQ